MSDVSKLQRTMYGEYSKSVKLDPNAQYYHGTPLRPVVPLDTASGGLFVLGAYPSARFMFVGGITDVPVADNLGPFENERWFDGTRVRPQPSAKELHDLFLEPLNIDRKDCWITDLVKVFLFKPGHVDRYEKLKATPPAGYTRDRFYDLGRESLHWISRELQVAKPRLVVTLGAEVAGVVNGVRSAGAQTKLLKPEVVSCSIGGMEFPTMHCAHPGILMRKGDTRNKWPKLHEEEFLPALKAVLK